MHTVIGGLGKSGTTALYYAVRAGMPAGTRCYFEPKRFRPTSARHVLVKILAQRGVDWGSFRAFDRKIAILRDPRDQLVSFVLYAIYNHVAPLTDSEAGRLLDLLARKEADSRAVSLWEISEAIEGITGWDHRAVLQERHGLCSQFLADDPDFFQIRYADFVAGRTEALNDYLGFPVARDVQVPSSLRRVERTRGAGDWRNWLTEEDVAYFRPALQEFIRSFGFNEDWPLPHHARVQPEYGSEYLRRLIVDQRQRTSWHSRWKRGVRKAVDWTRDRYLRT